jgi:glycosyltransferase involved in cell wall biosynthesis
MAEQAGIKHFYIFRNQSQQALNEMYRAADVFVLPTMEDVWGLVVNEAMWAGTPVLCSQYAGCASELVAEENMFDPLSADSFDAALAKVINRSVCPPDKSKLKTWQEISAMICRALDSESGL